MPAFVEFNVALCEALGFDADRIERLRVDLDGERLTVVVWHLPDLSNYDGGPLPSIDPTVYRLVEVDE